MEQIDIIQKNLYHFVAKLQVFFSMLVKIHASFLDKVSFLGIKKLAQLLMKIQKLINNNYLFYDNFLFFNLISVNIVILLQLLKTNQRCQFTTVNSYFFFKPFFKMEKRNIFAIACYKIYNIWYVRYESIIPGCF